MIDVSKLDRSKSLSSAKGKSSKVGSGGSFSSYLNIGAVSEQGAVSAASAIAVNEAIFATQMVGSEEEKAARQYLCKRGSTLLSGLEEIRDGLLMGHISKDRLLQISRMVKDQKVRSTDEKLQEIITEIELRVEVELAKLTR